MRTWSAAVLSSTLAATAMLGGVGAATSAGAAIVPAWTAPTALPAGTTLTGSTLAVSPAGHTILLTTSGTRDLTPSAVGSNDYVSATTAAFLPNGDSVVNDSYDGFSQLTYRFANGSLGGSIRVSNGISSFVANSHELLVIVGGYNSPQSAASYAINGNGTFTANGAAVPIFSQPVFRAWAALDADGQADVVMGAYLNNYDTIAVVEARRTAAGAWQSPTTIAPSINNGLVGAVSPTGQIVAAWTDATQTRVGWSEPHLYAAVRQPGQGMGTAQTLLSRTIPDNGYVDTLDVRAAAGPDGTLAVTARTDDCASEDVTLVPDSSVYDWIAAPGSSALSGSVVPGTTATKTHYANVNALGAGHGEALVALHETDMISDSSGSYVAYSCGSETQVGDQEYSFTDVAYLSGVGAHAFGTGHASESSTSGTVQDVSISAASIDAAGNAAVIGGLTSSTAVEYAMFDTGAVGVVTYPSPTGTNPAGGGAGTGVVATVPPVQKPAASTVVTVPDLSSNSQTIYDTNTTTGQENLTIAETAYASGLTTQAPHLDLGTSKKKVVTVASAKLHIAAHHKATIHLHLTAAAWKALKAKGKLTVTLKITTTEAGYATKVVTKNITLHYKKPKSTKH